MTTTIDATDIARLLADKLITFLETGQAPEGLFTADAAIPAGVIKTGFLLEVEETWEAGGDQWYCRELMRAGVTTVRSRRSWSTAPATGTPRGWPSTGLR